MERFRIANGEARMLSRRSHGRNLCRRVHSGGCRATGGIRVSGISGTTSIGKAVVWDHAMARVSGHGWVAGDRYGTGDSGRLPLERVAEPGSRVYGNTLGFWVMSFIGDLASWLGLSLEGADFYILDTWPIL